MEFRNLRFGGVSPVGSPAIQVYPGGALGATISFEHKGEGGEFYIGFGIAYPAPAHNPPFQFIYGKFTLNPHASWTAQQATVSGYLNTDVALGRLLDTQKFISDTAPTDHQQPPNPYGQNNWDDDVYGTPAAEDFFRPPAGYNEIQASYW